MGIKLVERKWKVISIYSTNSDKLETLENLLNGGWRVERVDAFHDTSRMVYILYKETRRA